LDTRRGINLQAQRFAFVALLIVAVMALMGPAVAATGSSERPQVVHNDVVQKSPSTEPASLPFTGSDVTAFAVAGVVAIGTGVVLVRKTRTRSVRA
jgi:LPXTG-motif cell wall-anchored protein